MPELSQTTIIVIVIAILLLAALVVMGPRLRRFTVTGGGVTGTAEGGTPGANVTRNRVEGDLNEAAAEGDNSTISGNTVKGSGNKFGAKSGGG
jgi:hypothetical protein